jgi:hypothetical protein
MNAQALAVGTQAEQRLALQAAVNGLAITIDGKTKWTSGYPTQPAVPVAYDVWPVWVATRPVAMCVDEIDWQILLAVPGPDPQTWAATGDALVEAIAEALAAWDLTRIEPVQILLAEGASMPGLQFTVTI